MNEKCFKKLKFSSQDIKSKNKKRIKIEVE